LETVVVVKFVGKISAYFPRQNGDLGVVVLKRHFLKAKKAFDLKKIYGAFSDIIRYIWAKFEQNRVFSRGRVISHMFDFY
jgi:hypothetical protein